MAKTVKEILAERKAKEDADRKRENELWERRRKDEAKQLDEARDKIAEALDGFKYTEGGDQFGRQFKLKFGNRNVYVVYKFENHEVRYSDDTQPVDVRSLSIDIGYIINRPSQTTYLEAFPESFAQFLKRERLA